MSKHTVSGASSTTTPRIRRSPQVKWEPAREGIRLRFPSAALAGPDFRLVTARATQEIVLPAGWDAVWVAAETACDLETLVKRVHALSPGHAQLPREVIVRCVQAMTAAGFLVAKPALGPFVPADSGDAHIYRHDGRTFAIDPRSRSLWALSPEAAGYLRSFVKGGDLSRDKQPGSEVPAALAQLGARRAAGFFQPLVASEAVEAAPARRRVLRDVYLTLDLARGCNLACRYCYVHEKTPPVMSDATMRAAVDFFFRHFNARRYQIRCVPNGEVAVNLDRICRVHAYASERARELGVNLMFAPLFSNGVGITPAFLRRWRECFPTWAMGLSLDGSPEVQDAVRVDHHGRGSYARTARALKLLQKEGCFGALSVTVTPAHPRILDTFLHLRGLGVDRMTMRWARLPRTHSLAFTPANIGELCAGYTEFARWLAALDDRALMREFRALIEVDYFKRFVIRLVKQLRAPYRCYYANVNLDVLTVDPAGGIYTCNSLCGSEAGRIGSVFTGLDPDRERFFREGLHVVNIAKCRTCWARHLCGGGCYHQAYLVNGRLDAPDPVECRLNQHLIELAGWFADNLLARGPGVVRAALGEGPWPPARPVRRIAEPDD